MKLKTKIQEKFQKIWSRYVESGFFLIFPVIWSHVNEKERKVTFEILRFEEKESIGLEIQVYDG